MLKLFQTWKLLKSKTVFSPTFIYIYNFSEERKHIFLAFYNSLTHFYNDLIFKNFVDIQGYKTINFKKKRNKSYFN